MVNLTTYELSLIAGKRCIKNYKNMSREKLLRILDKSEHILKGLSQKGLKRMTKMQNLLQNEVKQITKMKNLSQNELEQIAEMRLIKNYKNISREELLIALLKSKQSRVELYKSKSNNAEIEETVDLLYNSLHKISLNRGRSHTDSHDWTKHKKATINPKSKDNKYFRDATITALNHEKIKYNPERISHLKPFFDQYN